MDDLISRQALMKEFSDFVRASNNSDFARTPTWNDAVSLVESMPSAQPQRKTGRWIHDGYAFKGGIDWMHCSECGHKDCWSAATRTPFCAWCGAKMEEPEDIPMEYFENGGR